MRLLAPVVGTVVDNNTEFVEREGCLSVHSNGNTESFHLNSNADEIAAFVRHSTVQHELDDASPYVVFVHHRLRDWEDDYPGARNQQGVSAVVDHLVLEALFVADNTAGALVKAGEA